MLQDLEPEFVNIEDEMKKSYLEYSMSVIVGRALPDIRDGLKPVHRRVLFAMNDLKNFFNRPYKKSARVVGDVIGKYHPHGDSAVYDTIVRMAQDFSLRYCLVDGQGNFGSVDGDPPAAMRYTEVRMTRTTQDFLADLDKETVDFAPTYDGSLLEPLVLPTKVPNLLINGSSGIAVGMATNIPPHNLLEICAGIEKVIENPDVTLGELMSVIPGPDFPTSGFIIGKKGIVDAYSTGRGIIKVRARAFVEKFGNNKERIIVSEIPYQVNKGKLLEKIAAQVRDKKIEGISEIRDESDRDGMRIVVETKRDAHALVILNKLYKYTQMKVSFGIILLAIVDGRPEILTLKAMINHFIKHRREVIVRRTIFDLKKAEARAHILEGLKKALDFLDEVIELIRSSSDAKEAKARLIAEFQFSDIQAQAILDMRLQRLTGLEREKIHSEYCRRRHGGDRQSYRVYQTESHQPLPGPATRWKRSYRCQTERRGFCRASLCGLFTRFFSLFQQQRSCLLEKGSRNSGRGKNFPRKGHCQSPGSQKGRTLGYHTPCSRLRRRKIRGHGN